MNTDTVGRTALAALLIAFAAFLVVTLGGCDPVTGGHCSNPNDVYSHGNTRLVCGWDNKWHA